MSQVDRYNDTEIIVFRVGEVIVGLPINEVREIFKPPEFTPVHTRYDYVKGVINLRGNIVTIIDLNWRMGLSEPTLGGHIVLVEFRHELIGLLVDKIEDSVFGRSENFFQVPGNINGADADFFKAIYRRDDDLVAMLDLENTMISEHTQ